MNARPQRLPIHCATRKGERFHSKRCYAQRELKQIAFGERKGIIELSALSRSLCACVCLFSCDRGSCRVHREAIVMKRGEFGTRTLQNGRHLRKVSATLFLQRAQFYTVKIIQMNRCHLIYGTKGCVERNYLTGCNKRYADR